MELLQIKCPTFHSAVLQSHTTYATQYHGRPCPLQMHELSYLLFRDQKDSYGRLENPCQRDRQVVKATRRMGLNAPLAFEKAKNTILAWERRFRDLHQVLFLYALVHEFLKLVIEGDEAYTKVRKNVPPEQSPGWTILLLDRASRFIWELDCGKKERQLFHKAITSLDKIA